MPLDDDSLLEKYDEPVPLLDPNASVPLDPPPPPPSDKPAPPAANSQPPVLPEQIGLAPASEIMPPPERPST